MHINSQEVFQTGWFARVYIGAWSLEVRGSIPRCSAWNYYWDYYHSAATWRVDAQPRGVCMRGGRVRACFDFEGIH